MSETSPPVAATGPLHNTVVIDLTQHLAGPFATQILGDLGARVIKIEPPDGDSTRTIGPHFVDGDSAYYLSVNRNKESVCINLKTDAGRAALLRLVRAADAVVENFRPGTMEKLGIGADVLRELKPELVVCSLTGFGLDGPYRDRPAFDMIVQALSGGMSLTGDIGGRPVRSGLPIGDLCAGMNAAIATLAGLVRASQDGVGSRVDVAMLDTQISLLSYVASYYLTGGEVPGLQGRQHMSIPTYRAFTCADGRDIAVTANTPKMWIGLCRALGTTDLLGDPRFTTNEDRRRHRDELAAVLDPAALAMDSAHLLTRLGEEGVASAPINTVDAALADPHVRHRDMVVEQERGGEAVFAVGDPLKISDGRTDHRVAPRLGQDTEAVLRSLGGFTPADVAELAAAGAVGPSRIPRLGGRDTSQDTEHAPPARSA
ncbi:CaiB/BaiF CoA transferase family protein [Pseudonocardia sp. GCM10023141]|uniref:CaiB/BaiF CoA transferase family protein n=1 Tax=Pseudonocardia sp. GCM10023141 TaxID=3252653 RepID=UPI00360BE1F6